MEETGTPRSASDPNQTPVLKRPAAVAAQTGTAECPTCGGAGSQSSGLQVSYIYALGRVEARFARASAEKEFAQAIGRVDLKGKTDRQAFHQVLKQRENRYLARQLCWVFSVQGLDTYLLYPRDPADLELLVEALENSAANESINLVVGIRGPIAGPEVCNGLMIPIVAFDQYYSFDRSALIDAVPRPEKAPKEFAKAAGELIDRIMQITDNAGATDEHRALNYLVVRYPAIYAAVAGAHERNASLSAVDVRASRLSGARKIVDVILTFTGRATGVEEKVFARVDVTEEFPFLVTKLAPYFDR